MSNCKVYLGCPMTGYDKQKAIALSLKAKKVFNFYNIDVWSPVLEEGILGKGKIKNSEKDLEWKWPMDKEALNKCFVFVNMRADEKSFGCEREHGRHRFSEWQPVVIVSPKHSKGYSSIANYEDDLIVADIEEAALEISHRWGTWNKRVQWKLKILCHFPKWFLRQLRRLFQ